MSEETQVELTEADIELEAALRASYGADPEVQAAFRTQLADDVKNRKLQWIALDQERSSLRAHEALLSGPQRNVRSNLYAFRDVNGKPVNNQASGLNGVRARLAQIEHETQALEFMIDEGERRLAEMPEPEAEKPARRKAKAE